MVFEFSVVVAMIEKDNFKCRFSSRREPTIQSRTTAVYTYRILGTPLVRVPVNFVCYGYRSYLEVERGRNNLIQFFDSGDNLNNNS